MAIDTFFNTVKKSLGFASETKSYSLNDPYAMEIFGATTTLSGASVNASTALRNPSVLQAVRLIAENIGSLPCKAYDDAGDDKKAAKDHASYKIVHKWANEWTSAGQLRINLTLDALLHGDGYAKVIRYPDDRPFELHQLQRSKVERLTDSVTGAPVYSVTEGEGQHATKTLYPFTDILHISAFAGVSPVKLGREAIGVANTLEKHAAQFFGSGARPAVVISRDKVFGPHEDGATIIRNVRTGYAAAAADGFKTPFIADGGWTVTQVSFSSTDAQFVENRIEQINEIARIFGVPPHMLFQLDRATWSNAEQMSASFLQLCLRPWLDRWQDAYNTVLFSEDERDTHYCEFVIDDLQRADAAGRAEIFGKLIAARVMTPNEVRATMNMPALPGGDELANPYTTTTAPATATPPVKEAA